MPSASRARTSRGSRPRFPLDTRRGCSWSSTSGRAASKTPPAMPAASRSARAS
jgi:hypothetical protein